MYNDVWTAKWVTEKLNTECDNIANVDKDGANVLKINRKVGSDFTVFSMALDKIEHVVILEVTGSVQPLHFITNIKSDYLIMGSSLDYLQQNNISFGGIGDLLSFAGKQDNRFYEHNNISFIRRGLNQHFAVKSHRRLDNKRFCIEMKRVTNSFIIATTYDYDVNAASVRKSKADAGDFNILLGMNPYGGVTREALEIALTMNISVFMWKDFLANLHIYGSRKY